MYFQQNCADFCLLKICPCLVAYVIANNAARSLKLVGSVSPLTHTRLQWNPSLFYNGNRSSRIRPIAFYLRSIPWKRCAIITLSFPRTRFRSELFWIDRIMSDDGNPVNTGWTAAEFFSEEEEKTHQLLYCQHYMRLLSVYMVTLKCGIWTNFVARILMWLSYN